MKIGIANPSTSEMDKFLRGVVGVVEANSFESYCLWKDYHERGLIWISGGGGPMVQVGELADMPVCIALTVNEVDGHKILFVDATSRVVDHDMLRDWLQANAPVTCFDNNDPRRRLNFTDANNFHNVFPRASVDTRPKDEDPAKTGASLASGAVPKADAQTILSGEP